MCVDLFWFLYRALCCEQKRENQTGSGKGDIMSAVKTTGIRPAAGRVVLALVTAVVLMMSTAVANAAGSSVKLETPQIDAGSKKSLQRGAKLFVNYCMACHSANYQRYGRLARDIGLSEEDVASQLIFTTDSAGEPTKIGSLMENNMSAEYGRVAFGVIPPNLALTARCLLYTSPSPRDATLSRMPSSA